MENEKEKKRFASAIKSFNIEFDKNEDENLDFNKVSAYFQENYPCWKAYISDDDYQEDLGQALIRYSYSILHHQYSKLDETDIRDLLQKTEEFKIAASKKWNILESLYFNIAIGWNRIGHLYNSLSVDAFKHHIYYVIQKECRRQYSNFSFYKFYKCSEPYVIQSLANETLSVSDPSKYNDIFDCPLLSILKTDGTDLGKLLLQAYNECLKVACFVRNKVLSPISSGKIKKYNSNVPEYLNTLMWAHYADSHKGICIKYTFPNIPLQKSGENAECCSLFKDVLYVKSLNSTILEPIKKNNETDTLSAFFTKADIWKYENEVRLLNVNVKGKGEHENIPIPNAVEAIYFGVNCSDDDIKMIKNVMSNKTNVTFYRMVKDDKCFGKIKDVCI